MTPKLGKLTTSKQKNPFTYLLLVSPGAGTLQNNFSPLKNSEVGLSTSEIKKKIADAYPGWLVDAQQKLRDGRTKAGRRSS